MTVAAFTYSIGRSRWDNMPVQRQADTLRAFAHDVLSHRAVDKGSAGDKQVVGSCEAGSKEIVYQRG